MLTKTNEIQASLRTITKETENLFDFFNKEFYEKKLIRPVITIQTGAGKRLSAGWFSGNRWMSKNLESKYNEINISSEILNLKTEKGIPEIICTLLHEMVHLYNFQNNIKDVADNGAHHVKTFGKFAEKKGLSVIYTDRFPKVLTPDLSEEGIEVYQKSKFNSESLDKFRLDPRFSAIQQLGGIKTSSNDDDKKESEEQAEQKKPKQKKLFCPEHNYSVYVAFGFEHILTCDCGSVLLEAV